MRSCTFNLVQYNVRALRRIRSLWGASQLLTYTSLLTRITGFFVCSHRFGPSVRSVQ